MGRGRCRPPACSGPARPAARPETPTPPPGRTRSARGADRGRARGRRRPRRAAWSLDPAARRRRPGTATVLAGAVAGVVGATGRLRPRSRWCGADGQERFATRCDGRAHRAGGVRSPATSSRLTPAAVAGERRGRRVAVPAGGPGRTRRSWSPTGPARRTRFTLPGCVEPEAFSAAGDALFVLDYLPPTAPGPLPGPRARPGHRRRSQPLLTRDKQVVPAGAEEEMRGQGRQAVYSPGQQYLFTLYTHQPDHQHTRDLLAGRPRRRARTCTRSCTR